MPPFFKRKNDKTTIAELEEYYANQDRNGLKAWAMAFLSLIITVAIIAGLFFGGRWLYRTLTDDSDSEPARTPANGGLVVEPTDFDSDVRGSFDSDSEDNTSSNDESVTQVGGVVSDRAATTDSGSSGSVAANTTNSDADEEASSTEASEIPNTGASDLILIALIVAATGYLFSRKQQLSK